MLHLQVQGLALENLYSGRQLAGSDSLLLTQPVASVLASLRSGPALDLDSLQQPPLLQLLVPLLVEVVCLEPPVPAMPAVFLLAPPVPVRPAVRARACLGSRAQPRPSGSRVLGLDKALCLEATPPLHPPLVSALDRLQLSEAPPLPQCLVNSPVVGVSLDSNHPVVGVCLVLALPR